MTVALAELLGGQSHCLGEPAGEDNRHETAHVGSAEPTERHYSLLKNTPTTIQKHKSNMGRLWQNKEGKQGEEKLLQESHLC